jgi:hypothetical protein
VKVNAEPGDLLVCGSTVRWISSRVIYMLMLWWVLGDSRTPHYNLSATGNIPRFAAYTCYMPVADASPEDLIRKRTAFENRLGTTHWPNAMHTGSNIAKRNGEIHGEVRERPMKEPVLTERAFKLTGIPYMNESVA